MDDTTLRMMQMGGKGYSCAQIMILMALDSDGRSNPELVRSVGGLAYGCGSGRGTCGALTGGCCVIALFAGKGSDEETESERMIVMLQELSDWFFGRVAEYGGGTCEIITGEEGPASSRQRCGAIVAETYGKAMEILMSNGLAA
ncbi:MAG: DVU_1555 family C-GCAxxG-C-C protein [Desulfobacterales bacterium]